MSLIEYIVLGNYISFALIIFFYLLLFINNTIEKKIIREFKFITIIYFFLICSDIIECIYSKISSPFIFNIMYITTTNGYFLRTSILMLLVRIFCQNSKNKKIYIPFLINTICLVINIFYPLMFRYNGTELVRKSFTYLPHIVSAIYIIMMIYMVIKRFNVVDKNELRILIFTGIALAGSITIETVLGYRFILNSIALSLVVFYYLYLYDNVCKIDSITGLFTRRIFFNNIKQYLNDTFVVVSIDMNNLKKINDTLGHLTGDKALKEISEVILKGLLPRCNAYRVGGDEFVIICPKYEVSDIEVMMEDISLSIDEKNYSIAYGIALYEKGMKFDQALKLSDNLMYAKKRQMKKEMQK